MAVLVVVPLRGGPVAGPLRLSSTGGGLPFLRPEPFLDVAGPIADSGADLEVRGADTEVAPLAQGPGRPAQDLRDLLGG